jgi:phage head maturation protease
MEIEKQSKTLNIKSLEANEDEMKQINEYTLEPLTAEQVFTFKAVIGNNETDDRNLMPFSETALKDLAALYKGKTMIKDHNPSAENQIARVYATELRTDTEKVSGLNEPYTELIAKCYMAKTAENEGLISEIKAGIKREVSTGFAVSEFRCSICGEEVCRHRRGEEYDGKKCMRVIKHCPDAYELSFVAVPAQPNAGTIKAAEEPEKDEQAQLEAKKTAILAHLGESRIKYKF